MASPEVSSNPTEFQKIARAAADLEQAVTALRQYEQWQSELKEAKEMAAESAGICHTSIMQSAMHSLAASNSTAVQNSLQHSLQQHC